MDENKLDHYRTVLLEQLRQQSEAVRGNQNDALEFAANDDGVKDVADQSVKDVSQEIEYRLSERALGEVQFARHVEEGGQQRPLLDLVRVGQLRDALDVDARRVFGRGRVEQGQGRVGRAKVNAYDETCVQKSSPLC